MTPEERERLKGGPMSSREKAEKIVKQWTDSYLEMCWTPEYGFCTGSREMIDAITAALDEAAKVPEWHLLSKFKPSPYEPVIVYGMGLMTTAQYHEDGRLYALGSDEPMSYGPTHWTSFPTPPEARP